MCHRAPPRARSCRESQIESRSRHDDSGQHPLFVRGATPQRMFQLCFYCVRGLGAASVIVRPQGRCHIQLAVCKPNIERSIETCLYMYARTRTHTYFQTSVDEPQGVSACSRSVFGSNKKAGAAYNLSYNTYCLEDASLLGWQRRRLLGGFI